MRTCNRNMTAAQRRTMQFIGAAMAICASLSLELHSIEPHHFAAATYAVISLIGAAPIIFSMIVLARYLMQETDEYIRSAVVQSLLWGFGLVIVSDTILGYMMAFEAVDSIHLRTLGVFNMEIFLITAAIALRIRLWSDR